LRACSEPGAVLRVRVVNRGSAWPTGRDGRTLNGDRGPMGVLCGEGRGNGAAGVLAQLCETGGELAPAAHVLGLIVPQTGAAVKLRRDTGSRTGDRAGRTATNPRAHDVQPMGAYSPCRPAADQEQPSPALPHPRQAPRPAHSPPASSPPLPPASRSTGPTDTHATDTDQVTAQTLPVSRHARIAHIGKP
jgi:hypothetical protein